MEVLHNNWQVDPDVIVAAVVGAGVALLGTFIAAHYSRHQLKQEWSLATRRATLDLIMNEMHDPARQALRQNFESQRKNGKLRCKHGLDGLPEQVRFDTIAYLNRFETAALAINHKMIDEKMYKAWACSYYVQTWHSVEEIVEVTRTKCEDHSFYREFQKLAVRWNNDALPTKGSAWLRRLPSGWRTSESWCRWRRNGGFGTR